MIIIGAAILVAGKVSVEIRAGAMLVVLMVVLRTGPERAIVVKLKNGTSSVESALELATATLVELGNPSIPLSGRRSPTLVGFTVSCSLVSCEACMGVVCDILDPSVIV